MKVLLVIAGTHEQKIVRLLAGSSRLRRCWRCRRRRQARIDPTGVDSRVQTFGRFGVDIALPDHAAKCRLDMTARTAKAIVQVEMAERGIEIIAPQQVHDAAPEPYALRIRRRTGQEGCGLGELVDFLLVVLARLGLLIARGLTLVRAFRLSTGLGYGGWSC